MWWTMTAISCDYRQPKPMVLQLRGGGGANGQVKSNSASEDEEATEFLFFIENARSIQTEERFEEMLCELDGLTYETWREEKDEMLKLPSGEVWFGSGGTPGKHGVGILFKRGLQLKKVLSNIGTTMFIRS